MKLVDLINVFRRIDALRVIEIRGGYVKASHIFSKDEINNVNFAYQYNDVEEAVVSDGNKINATILSSGDVRQDKYILVKRYYTDDGDCDDNQSFIDCSSDNYEFLKKIAEDLQNRDFGHKFDYFVQDNPKYKSSNED